MSRLLFYIQYAARNLWRNRRWSAFAMLSVAAGVATVVGLRSLGLAIGDSLTTNLQSANKGDITLERGGVFALPGDFQHDEMFHQWQVDQVRDWASQKNATVTVYTNLSLQVSAADGPSGGLLNFMSAILIDPETYPTTQDIVALDPDGVPLADLFNGGREVIVSENLAETQGLAVGDLVRVSGTDQPFTVRGIVDTGVEAGLRDPFSAFFGFVYIDEDMAGLLSIDSGPNAISILLPEGTTDEQIRTYANELHNIVSRDGGWVRVITVPNLLEQNQFIADLTGRFIVVMGLGAMLIGGVGIINTMLVVVRRRTTEIAALKTFGLKGRQVAFMFMTEALLLGAIGSVIGSIIGAFLGRLTLVYGETFIQQTVTWRIYPEAILFGVVLGLVVTAVFGVLPVLTAVKVRPGIILRPNETAIPALGVIQSLLVLLFVVVSLGLIAGQIVGPVPEEFFFSDLFHTLPLPAHYSLGVVGVAVTLAFLALLVGLLSILVWLVSKLPTFGWIDMRLALKNLGTRRLRTATVLLAISTGMFAISSITFYGASVREILQTTLSDTLGGNVMIINPLAFASTSAAANADQVLDNKLDELEGITYRTRLRNFNGNLIQVDDLSLRSEDLNMNREQLLEEIRQASRDGDFERVQEISEQLNQLSNYVEIGMRDTDNPRLTSGDILNGRDLNLADRGQPVAVVLMEPRMSAWGVNVGSTLILRTDRREFSFEVIGLIADKSGFQASPAIGDVMIPADTLPGVNPSFQFTTIEVEPEHINDVVLAISAMPFFFPLNVEFIDGVIRRFIDQFSALPLLVGILSLGAAAVIMANTVALATLERRRQIGILKAVGLKSRRVLSIMLLENTLVSLLGGVLGIGLSVLGVVVMSLLGLDELVLVPRDARPVAVGLVIAAVFIGGMATLLSANTAVRERVLNVLRYE